MSSKKRELELELRAVWVNSKENWIPIFLPLPRHYRTPHSWFQPKLRRIKKSLNPGDKNCTWKHNMFALADYFWLKWRIKKLCVPQIPPEIVFSRTAKIYLQCMRLWFCIPSVKVILRWILNYWHIYKKKNTFFLEDDSRIRSTFWYNQSEICLIHKTSKCWNNYAIFIWSLDPSAQLWQNKNMFSN